MLKDRIKKNRTKRRRDDDVPKNRRTRSTSKPAPKVPAPKVPEIPPEIPPADPEPGRAGSDE